MKRRLGFRSSSGPVGGLAPSILSRTSLSRLAVLGLSSYVGIHCSSAQLTILHSFGDGTVTNDGAVPAGGLIQAPDGNFYGTTVYQAQTSTGGGTVYQLTLAGTVQTLHVFPNSGEKRPAHDLLYYNGDLIGVASSPLSYSVVFRTTLSGKTVTWYDFNVFKGTQNGAAPEGSLILGSDGNLYGTTYGGGANGFGTIYKISPDIPHPFTSVYSFTASTGTFPDARLLLAQDGNYYGTTESGVPGGAGTVFQMTPAGQVTSIYQFPGATDYCDAPLIQDQNGNFYGVTIDGGTYGGGYAFKMSSTFQVTILHQFGKGKDASWPNGVVLGPNGNLYGTSGFGGSKGRGAIFEVSTDGSFYKVLHNFADGSVPNDGEAPETGLTLGSDNNLYGTTNFGGSAGNGTIFRITP